MLISTLHRLRLELMGFAVLLITLSVFMQSCTNPTKPELGHIEGTVRLVNGNPASSQDVDYRGFVSIGLYQIVEDTPITVASREYSGTVGSAIGQGFLFDHRDHDPISVLTTNWEGGFSFDDVPVGRYNLVFLKASWGFRYILDVEVERGKGTVIAVDMYPLNYVNDMSSVPEVFLKDRVYHITSDISIITNSVFEEGTTLLLDPYVSLSLLADPIMTGGSRIRRFWSSDGINDLARKNDRLRYNRIMTGSGVSIENASFGDAYTGIFWGSGQGSIINSVFLNCTDGILVSNAPILVENCTFSLISNRAIDIVQTAINDPAVESIHIRRNIFHGCLECFRSNGHNLGIEKNLFIDNQAAIVSNSGYHSIRDNVFSGNIRSIVCYGSSANITSNVFDSVGESHIVFLQAYYMSLDTPVISNNNFINTQSFSVYSYHNAIFDDVNAVNNYWSAEDVGALVWDKDDDPEIGGRIIYFPRLSSPNPNAGI